MTPHIPGLTPRPARPVAPGLASGLALYRAGAFWEAHEAWEPVWLGLPPNAPERALVQGLIQLANARLKLAMGRARAARRIADLAAEALARAGSARLGALPPDWAGTELAEIRRLAGSEAEMRNNAHFAKR